MDLNDHNNVPFPTDADAPCPTKQKNTPVASASGEDGISKTRIGFKTIKAADLIQTEFEPLVSAVDDLISEGLTMLCGASKIGKSWFVLDLCHSVASGNKFLGRETMKGDVLYLALEDSERRLKDRLIKLGLAQSVPSGLEFTTQSDNIDNGLLEDIETWINKSKTPRLIVIDTMQKIRGKSPSRVNAYAADYEIIGKLKSIADKNKICIVLVHHLNKMKAKDVSDPFDRISGSTGLMSAADSTILLLRDRDSNTAIVKRTGRDVKDDSDFVVTMNEGKWTASGETAKQYRDEMFYQNSGIVAVIKELLAQSIAPYFEITTADFKEYGAKKGYIEFACSDKELRKQMENIEPLLLERDCIGFASKGKVKGRTQRGLKFFRTDKKA